MRREHGEDRGGPDSNVGGGGNVFGGGLGVGQEAEKDVRM